MAGSGSVDGGRADAAYTETPARESVRATPVPDLRFKWVGEDDFEFHTARTTTTMTLSKGFGGTEESLGSVSITPLELWLEPRSRAMPMSAPDIGDDKNFPTANWYYSFFNVFPSVGPLSATGSAGVMPRFERDMVQGLAKKHRIVNSFDIAIAASEDYDGYAFTAVGRADQEQIYERYVIDRKPMVELETVLQQQASEGLVTTALAGNGSLVTFFSYDRIGDKNRYEVKLLVADFESLDERARLLAEEGYMITAFGRDLEALLLVGTRVEGTLEPRSIELLQDWWLPDEIPGAIVARVSDNEGNHKVILQR